MIAAAAVITGAVFARPSATARRVSRASGTPHECGMRRAALALNDEFV